MEMTNLPARFIAKFRVEHSTGCWIWTGTVLGTGYGQFYVGGGKAHRVQKLAHRFAYEALVAPIPKSLTIDHVCRTRRCVNPEHMDVVSRGENTLRGLGPSATNRRKKRCKRGHPFTAQNTYVAPDGSRQCRACIGARSGNSYENRAAYFASYRHSERGKEVQRRYRARKRAKVAKHGSTHAPDKHQCLEKKFGLRESRRSPTGAASTADPSGSP